MILSQFHQLFSIDHSLGPILTHWVTKYKYELSVMWHQLLKNIVSEDWLDSKEPSRSKISKCEIICGISQGIIYWTYIQGNMGIIQTGEKMLLNNNAHDWFHI